jgi:hypothetical protein
MVASGDNPRCIKLRSHTRGLLAEIRAFQYRKIALLLAKSE